MRDYKLAVNDKVYAWSRDGIMVDKAGDYVIGVLEEIRPDKGIGVIASILAPNVRVSVPLDTIFRVGTGPSVCADEEDELHNEEPKMATVDIPVVPPTREPSIFDLEQAIMQCWGVVDDIDMIYKHIGDSAEFERMSTTHQDKIMNLLLGISELYQLKFDVLWNEFTAISSEYHRRKRPSNPFD